MSIKILQLHKRSSYDYKYIQDKFAIDNNAKVLSLSDGTTQSFKSELWAEIITDVFIKHPTFNPVELIEKFVECVDGFKKIDYNFSSNPALASLEKAKMKKGGTATFLGVKLANNKIEMISSGDSNLFMLNQENKLTTFPFSDLNSLDSNNHFINTEHLLEGDIDSSFFYQNTFEFNFGNKLILATDALSRLLLNKPSIINELLTLSDFNSFQLFCVEHWESNELQEDDITAIIVVNNNLNIIERITPPNDFLFPKEIENTFVPITNEIKPTELKYTPMQMQEIKNQFNGVASDFNQVKKKLVNHEMLLIITIILVIVNISSLFLFTTFGVTTDSKPKIVKTDHSAIIKKRDETIKDLKADYELLKKENNELTKKISVIENSDLRVVTDKINKKNDKNKNVKENEKKTDKNSSKTILGTKENKLVEKDLKATKDNTGENKADETKKTEKEKNDK